MHAQMTEEARVKRQRGDSVSSSIPCRRHWSRKSLRWFCTYPFAVFNFYRRLSAAFGLRFVCIVFFIYGLSQGIAESFAFCEPPPYAPLNFTPHH